MEIWSGPGLLHLGDEDMPQAAELWRQPGAKVIDIGADTIAVTTSDGDGRLDWRAATGEFDAATCWLLDANHPWFARPTAAALTPLRKVWPMLDDTEVAVAVAAVALAAWHASCGYCPACGHPTDVEPGGWSRRCPACNAQHFPRIDPAIIVALIDDRDRLLLGGQASWGNRRSVVAGFVMAGESAEQAVHREVAEEVGLSVDQLHYFGSQPWPFPRSLMLAFTAHVTNPEAMHPDGREIVAADWYTRDEARQAWADGTVDPPPPMSIAHRLITSWLDGMTGKPVM